MLHDIGCETPVFGAGRPPEAPDRPLHFLVMEYLDGQTLADRLREGPLPLEQALDVGAQIADALATAHHHGIVHRDLTPANVMLTRSHGGIQAKLLDFGLAKLDPSCWDAAGELSTAATPQAGTTPGVVMGTLPYMAPEQLEGKEPDARTDLFGFGCVLYEMLTGRRAFAGDSAASVISAIMTSNPLPPTFVQPTIPQVLDRLVTSCLAKDRDERRQSAHDLAEDLRALAESADARRSLPAGASRETTVTGPRHLVTPRRIMWSLLTIVCVTLAVTAYRLGWGRASEGVPFRGVPTQLTSAPGLQSEPAVSPDGSLVAFVSDQGGIPHIWVVDQEGTATLQLTFGPTPDHNPAWLPDDNTVLFDSNRNGGPGIWKVTRLGGPETLVVADAADPAVSPDGSLLAFVREVSPSGYERIFVAPLADAARTTRLTTDADGMWAHRNPAWSPDGRWLCYSAQHSLWVVSPQRRGARRLTFDEESAFDPVWSADGRSVFYASLREGTVALWKVDVGSGTVSRVTLGSGPERHPSVSRDGSTLAYSTEMVDRNIVLHEIDTGREQSFGTLRSEYMPAFCGTEPAVLFASDRVGGRDELWLQPLAGSRPSGDARRLTNHPGNVSHPACSRDGRWVAYYRIVEGRRHIWTVPSAGGPPIQFTSDPSSNIHPAWSKDGTRLAFVSDRSGQDHIWVEPVVSGKPTGPAVQVTLGAAEEMDPEWSPDGAWIAYVVVPTDSDADVWVTSSDGHGAPRRVTMGAEASRVRWYQTNRMLVSSLWHGTTLSVRAVDAESGAVTALNPPVVLDDDPDMCDFDLSPDGRTLAFARTSRRGNIWRWSGRF